ncbi:hypothetical protein TBR22_A10790 [Luteitalea sp. TBR-22]|nr:hypothetical protein TBR22_A10790 [Luteitalea sp. TBR-22]
MLRAMPSPRLAILVLTLACQAIVVPVSAQSPTPVDGTGWQPLFDGHSLDAWRGYRRETLPEHGWAVSDGLLKTVPKVKGSELITRKAYRDFELAWDWRVAPGGNNGVKYFVTEARPSAPGHEYQMIDDTGYPAALTPLQHTAGFYDVLAARTDTALRPAGEWNTSRIIVRGTRVEHWLNGQHVLTYELGSPEVKAGIAASKFRNAPGFGDKIDGHIMLTYHQDECWYRNIRIRELQ